MRDIFSKCTGFDWDQGNSEKNWIAHHVNRNESEQVFFNEPVIVAEDERHSQNEKRWYLLGRTDSQRFLFIVFTIRANLIRVISARDMNKKERRKYNEQV
jgi:uncharacterized DUF497 family protein